jgi:hypothetical protein
MSIFLESALYVRKKDFVVFHILGICLFVRQRSFGIDDPAVFRSERQTLIPLQRCLSGPLNNIMAIAISVEKLFDIFQQTIQTFDRPTVSHNELDLYPQACSTGLQTTLEEDLGRFRVWANDIGAHRIGRSSLDFRLRDALHLVERILSLLEDLTEALDDGEFGYDLTQSFLSSLLN